ncbi:MAG: hypothetical protein WEB58_05885 [Planctomycetaceae bacterium]
MQDSEVPTNPNPDIASTSTGWRTTFRGPKEAWGAAALLQIIVLIPFWWHSSPGFLHDIHGDLHRGWPLVYGLDQGDVVGDGWGPFTIYFQPIKFAADTLLGMLCALPGIVLILWRGRRLQQKAGRITEYTVP